MKLVPQAGRGLAEQALDDCAKALRLWLMGQLVSMVLVGVLVGTGLWLIGVPAPLTLGILAALLEFIPIVGPILSAIPAIVLALVIGPETALWTAALYLGVQQLEGNLIQPIVQQRAVDLPPALLLFALLAFGLLFGVRRALSRAPDGGSLRACEAPLCAGGAGDADADPHRTGLIE